MARSLSDMNLFAIQLENMRIYPVSDPHEGYSPNDGVPIKVAEDLGYTSAHTTIELVAVTHTEGFVRPQDMRLADAIAIRELEDELPGNSSPLGVVISKADRVRGLRHIEQIRARLGSNKENT